MAMTEKQACAWIEQEAAKITTPEAAAAHLKAFEASKPFMNSPAGQAAGARDPFARAARYELAARIALAFPS